MCTNNDDELTEDVWRNFYMCEWVTFDAFERIYELDKEFFGTKNYMGISIRARGYEYELRKASQLQRQKIHTLWLEAGLDLETEEQTTEHTRLLEEGLRMSHPLLEPWTDKPKAETVWDEDAVRHWFGERGMPFADNAKIRFKSGSHEKSNYLFVSPVPYGYGDDDDTEVGLYNTDSMCVELEDSFSRKGFSWSEENLSKIVAWCVR